ncbi:MAG: RNA polymerase sigma factor SigJ [Chloroflexota bacterium]|nr:RNA polymerase sigma factor SigJ [Chloroflexota bacterium]
MSGNANRTARIDAAEFEALRPYLFAIAYRLLGSASEAEDIVQEAYLRARDAAEEIRSIKAYLATIVTRLCLNHLTSARVMREAYPGPWLPEPVPSGDADPAGVEAVARGEEVSLGLLVLLERLTPEERAAYVLREAFDYPYDEIGLILSKSVAATRQLAHRARERIAAGRRRFTATPEQQRRLTERFLAASRRGDLPALMEILAADVTAWADGGEKRPRAARRPILGRDKVARWLVVVLSQGYPEARATTAEVNGGVALLLWSGEELAAAAMIDVAGERIAELRFLVNPDKLAYLQRRLGGPGPPFL